MREMKDSGILGVGKVPADWGQSRLSYECYIRARLGWRGLKADEYVDEGYAFISAFNIQNGKLVWKPLNYITQERYDESPEIKLNIGDVLLVKDGAGVGKSARVDSLPCGGTAPNSSIGVITPNDTLSHRYVCYYFQSPVFSNFVGLLYNGMGVPHLTQEILKTIRIPMPSLSEQQSISDHLDSKCNELDSITSDIQSQIETLEEYKRSVITEAVTKGLNPDVEMKDSGVAWIGDVPKHWLVEKVKFHLFRNEPRNPGDKQVLSVYREYGVIPKDSRDDNHNVTSEDTSNYKYVVPGNLVINKMKAWQGSMGVSEYEGIVSPAYFIYKFTDNQIMPKYLHYLFRNCYKDEFRRISGGIREGQWDLSPYEFSNTLLLIPPTDEQIKIVSYIDARIGEIETVITEKKQQIETIEEYKKSLIFEYVTGKKEV